MIQKTTIRTTGVVLLIVANLLLVFSMLFSMYSGGRPNSGSKVGVLFVSSTEARFPEAEYRGVFSGLGLKSDFIGTDVSDEERLARRIQSFSRRQDVERIVLVAYEDAAAVAMKVSESESSVAGLILIMPRIETSFGSEVTPEQLPGFPVAIFDSERLSTKQLFEKLSGEDTTLTSPLKSPGIFASLVYISPDAKTFMSLKKLFGDSVLDAMIYPGLPDVQRGVADYIAKYALQNEENSSGVRGMIFLNQALRIIPVALLISGLFFFLSTIAGPRSVKGVAPKEVVRESSVPKELSLRSKIARSEKYLLALLLPLSIAYGVILCVLLIAVPRYAAIFSALWPVLALSIAALFYIKHLKKMASPMKANRARLMITLLVSGLFVIGILFVVLLHVSSVRYILSFPRILLFLVPVVLLSLSLAACQKMDMFYTDYEKTAEHRMGFLSAWRFRGILLLPFIAMLITSVLTLKGWLLYLSLYSCLLMIASDWFRQRVKRMSGTLFLPSIMASLLYVILAFV